MEEAAKKAMVEIEYKNNLALYPDFKKDLADEVRENGINDKKGRALNHIKFKLKDDQKLKKEINDLADKRKKLLDEFTNLTKSIKNANSMAEFKVLRKEIEDHEFFQGFKKTLPEVFNKN